MQILQGNTHAFTVVGKRKETVELVFADLETELGASPKTHVDVLFIETSQFTIEDAAKLKSWQKTMPEKHTKKFAVLSAFSFTKEAQNALLKTIEEPAGNTTIAILVETSRALLPTILSRTLLIPVHSTTEATQFPKELIDVLSLSPGERLAHPYIAELITKKDPDGKVDREGMVDVLRYFELALQLYREKSKPSKEVNDQFLKAGTVLTQSLSYVRDTGASLKILLEHALLSMPVFDKNVLNIEGEMIH
jgi:hypothetical protein